MLLQNTGVPPALIMLKTFFQDSATAVYTEELQVALLGRGSRAYIWRLHAAPFLSNRTALFLKRCGPLSYEVDQQPNRDLLIKARGRYVTEKDPVETSNAMHAPTVSDKTRLAME